MTKRHQPVCQGATAAGKNAMLHMAMGIKEQYGAGMFTGGDAGAGQIVVDHFPKTLVEVGMLVAKDWFVLLRGTPSNPECSPYEVLGIKPDADKDEVKNAHYFLSLKFHLDRIERAPVEVRMKCKERIAIINSAAATLLGSAYEGDVS